jgi:CheY-like chemotaxis protein
MGQAASEDWLVLIVEDDPLIGLLLQDMLEQAGCRYVGPAGSIAAAMTAIDNTPSLDGAVLDCNLGSERVWPVADRLVALEIPFVFSTGYGEAGIVPRFRAYPVLAKPYSPTALKNALVRVLAKRQP